jgi:stage III sporulation protein SpoIIIAA
MLLADDLNQLLDVLPKFISDTLQKHPNRGQLIEIVLDIGRRPEARFANGTQYLSYRTIVWQDLDHILKRLGKFSGDNRAGIEKTLHRISSLRNRQGSIIGLTCRIGRAIFGTVSIVRDLLEQKKSILLLGRPGVGKTTAIREIARVLSDGMQKRVIIIDTSNEIAGDGDLPHPSIGKARRMQVSNHQNQHEVMIEAVENHMPEIIIIDEIGTELEAKAAQTITERGVQLIGTAHGNYLGSLVKNPTLSDLVGGIQYVTLSDEEARRRGTQKSILERKGPTAFNFALEINERLVWTIHEKVEESVDMILQGLDPKLQVRNFTIEGQFKIYLKKPDLFDNFNNNTLTKSNKLWRRPDKLKVPHTKLLPTETSQTLQKEKKGNLLKPTSLKNGTSYIYTYSVSSNLIIQCSKSLNLNIVLTDNLDECEFIIGLKNHLKNN